MLAQGIDNRFRLCLMCQSGQIRQGLPAHLVADFLAEEDLLENAPVFGSRVIESDMSDVLRDMALGGRGVAWLTESTVAAAGRKGLIAIGGDKWSVPLSLVAFKDRMNDQRPLNLFWSELCRHNAGQAGAGRGKPPAKSSARLPVKSSR